MALGQSLLLPNRKSRNNLYLLNLLLIVCLILYDVAPMPLLQVTIWLIFHPGLAANNLSPNLVCFLGLCPGMPRPSGAWDRLSIWKKCGNGFSGWCVPSPQERLHGRKAGPSPEYDWISRGRWHGDASHIPSFPQLIDDVLDFTSCSEQMGKPTSTDLKLGLATGPVLFACRQVGSQDAFNTLLGGPAGPRSLETADRKAEIRNSWGHSKRRDQRSRFDPGFMTDVLGSIISPLSLICNYNPRPQSVKRIYWNNTCCLINCEVLYTLKEAWFIASILGNGKVNGFHILIVGLECVDASNPKKFWEIPQFWHNGPFTAQSLPQNVS